MHPMAAMVEATLPRSGGQAEQSAPLPPPPPPLPLAPQQRCGRKCRVSLRPAKRPGFACALEGRTCLPLPAAVLFELLVHPDNAAILRSLDRCTYRRVVADDGEGRLACEVEHETTCHFLWFSGTVRTPLLVEQDAAAGTMQFCLDPRSTCGHPAALEGSWMVEADGPAESVPRVRQAFTPRGLPPLLGGAAKGFAASQLRGTCEDFYAEALRIHAGRPSLLLSSLATGHTVGGCGGSPQKAGGEVSVDPPSVLERLSAASSASGEEEGSDSAASPFAASSQGGSGSGSSARRPLVADMAASSVTAPASFPLLRLRSAASSCLDAFSLPPIDSLQAEPCPASRQRQRSSQGSTSQQAEPSGQHPAWLAVLLAMATGLSAWLHWFACSGQRPAWLAVLLAAVFRLLARLGAALVVMVRAELALALACTRQPVLWLGGPLVGP